MQSIKNYFNTDEIEIDEIVDDLLLDVNIKNFVFKNELTSNEIEPYLNVLLNYRNFSNKCKKCTGINECYQISKGMKPILSFYNSRIKIIYQKCQYKIKFDNANKSAQLINTMYLPKKILSAELSDFYCNNDERMDVYRYITRFLSVYGKENSVKGMYIHGKYGSGKTYALACIANELSKNNIKSILVYYPDLVRELKNSINDGTLEKKISMLKKVDVLMLDDIGGENLSAWVRDEILGPILQYRLLEELPTFFTSNLHAQDLVQNIVINDSIKEKTKAYRIYRRIISLAKEFRLNEIPK